MMEQMGDKKVCNCPHHKVVPWAIILIGLVVVLETFSILTGYLPMLLIGVLLVVIGGMKLMSRKCTCC